MTSSRLSWYLIFSVIVLIVLVAVDVPAPAIWGYLAVAGLGLVLGIRDARATRASRGYLMAAGEQIVARVARSHAAAKDLPWYEEVNAAQNAAIVRGAYMFGIFSSFNPYWSLNFDSLIRYGLTNATELDSVKNLARTSPPDAWLNPLLLNDLIRGGGTEEEALVRVGLFRANEQNARTERARAVMAYVDVRIRPGFHTDLRGFDQIAQWLISAGEPEVLIVRRRWEEWKKAFHDLNVVSASALDIGYALRSIRWPEPVDVSEAAEARFTLDQAAIAIEWAGAALAEPALDADQVSELYWSLDEVVPLAQLLTPG